MNELGLVIRNLGFFFRDLKVTGFVPFLRVTKLTVLRFILTSTFSNELAGDKFTVTGILALTFHAELSVFKAKFSFLELSMVRANSIIIDFLGDSYVFTT